MAEVKILIEGYTNADSKAKNDEEKTRTTTSLIKDGDIVAVVDPGVLESQQVMIDALKQENLTVGDITHVLITHSHMDHYRNIGMFPEAIAVDYWGVWRGEKVDDLPEKLGENIQVIKTPGHNYDGLTFSVQTEKGKIAVVGDVFWKENYPETDEYASDSKLLKESRKKVLKLADYIIPGHGKMWKVKKD